MTDIVSREERDELRRWEFDHPGEWIAEGDSELGDHVVLKAARHVEVIPHGADIGWFDLLGIVMAHNRQPALLDTIDALEAAGRPCEDCDGAQGNAAMCRLCARQTGDEERARLEAERDSLREAVRAGLSPVIDRTTAIERMHAALSAAMSAPEGGE